RALGAVQEDAVDVRLVSATHRDLPTLVQTGQFRQDLFYRLNVIGLRTPSLRERPEDLPLLAQALLERLCADAGQPLAQLSPAALAWLQARELPGNVRELENLLQRAMALANGPVLLPEDFGEGGAHESATWPGALSVALPLDAPPHAAEAAPDSALEGSLNASLDPRFVPLPGRSLSEPATELPDDLQHYLDEREREVLLRALKAC